MPTFLFRLSLILLAAAALLAGAAVWLGEALSLRPILPQPGFADCALPCWGTITPGETVFEQVVPMLRRVLPADVTEYSVSPSQVNFWTPEINGFLYYGAGRVGYMRLYAAIPAAYLMQALGTPDCVWIDSSFAPQDVLILYWERNATLIGALIIPNQGGGWRPDSAATNLWMSTTERACDQAQSFGWRGFAPLRRYQTQKPPVL